MLAFSLGGAVVHAFGRDRNAIGYAGMSFLTAAVAVVLLASDAEQPAVALTPDTVFTQRYPMVLFVNLYINRPPHSPLVAPLQELRRFVYSSQGQQLVADRGYVPLPVPIATAELQQLGRTHTR